MAKVNTSIASRRSRVAFADTPIASDILSRVFEAARWAPSSNNEQPWRFVYAQRHYDAARFDELTATLKPVNAVWAVHAPVIIYALTATHDSAGRLNRYALYDVGQAIAMLSIQATDDGLTLRQMGAFDRDAAREALALPTGIDPVVAIALGYPGDAATLPANLRKLDEASRERRPLEQLMFEGSYGDPGLGDV